MRKNFRSLHILSIPVVTGLIACASSAAEERYATPPTTQQVITAVFANQDTVFPPQQACAGTAQTTIGDHLLSSLVYAADEKNVNIDVNCTRDRVSGELIDFYSNEHIYPETAAATLKTLDRGHTVHSCRLTVSHNQGEAPWSRTIQMLLHGDDHTPVAGTFRCVSLP